MLRHSHSTDVSSLAFLLQPHLTHCTLCRQHYTTIQVAFVLLLLLLCQNDLGSNRNHQRGRFGELMLVVLEQSERDCWCCDVIVCEVVGWFGWLGWFPSFSSVGWS